MTRAASISEVRWRAFLGLLIVRVVDVGCSGVDKLGVLGRRKTDGDLVCQLFAAVGSVFRCS